MANTDKLLTWNEQQAARYGQDVVLAGHRLNELALFRDQALLDLLQAYPRERLQAFTMGTDPQRRDEWQPVDTTGASGADLMAALKNGRLWFNVLQVHLVDRRYRDLLERLYGELSERCAGFHPERLSCTLIMSSPSSMVYYHADAQPNLLWQLKGAKRIWVYPAQDEALIDRELMEDIFASFADEEVPYRSAFDAKARVCDLHPGEVLSWPQNSPHRVTNVEGVNISLSTVHETEASSRRKLVYCANRLFRRTYGVPLHSTRETGTAAWLKCLAYRGFNRAGLVKTPPRRAYLARQRIDADSPLGYRPIPDAPVLTEFSRKDFKLEKDRTGAVSVVQLGGAA